MTAFHESEPRVPDQLQGLIDDHFTSVHTRWQGVDFTSVVPHNISVESVDIGDEYVRVGHLRPFGEVDDRKVALAFPYQQGLNKTMLMRAAFMQQAVFPNSEVLLLPQVYRGNKRSFTVSSEDAQRMEAGSMRPIAEKYVRAFERLNIGAAALTGYSLGGRLAADIASVGGNFDVTGLNIDEAPYKPGRSAKQLQKDFMKSGGFFKQRKSMADAGFGPLMREYAGSRLVIDYGMFGVKSLGKAAKSVHKGMAGSDLVESVFAARANYPGLEVKVGNVEHSKLTDTSDLEAKLPYTLPGIRLVTYTGKGAHAHTTGDNYAAHALMVKDGLVTKA